MAGLAVAELSALIQVQRNVPQPMHVGQTRAPADDASSVAAAGRDLAAGEARSGPAAEHVRALDAANQFEALLIHNMLKGMRKTTLADDTSNERAMYNDMLDQKLADTMIEAGGLGISEQLMSQLLGKAGTPAAPVGSTQDRLRLRELAQSLGDDGRTQPGTPLSSAPAADRLLENTPAQDSVKGLANSDVSRLRMLFRLWGSSESDEYATARSAFLQPLIPHAQRSAQRLGTSASAILAIAALETGWGQSMLQDEQGLSSNNYFGIKATRRDTQFTRNTTTEYVGGKPQKVQALFKSYDSVADATAGFADFLLENPRYSTALQHAGNPERFLHELHKAGYATDPDYTDKAIKVLRQVERHTSQP